MAGSVIISGARTPIGKLSGAFASLCAVDLGAAAIAAALERAGVEPEKVGYVYMGQILQAGQAELTARQAAAEDGVAPATTTTMRGRVEACRWDPEYSPTTQKKGNGKAPTQAPRCKA